MFVFIFFLSADFLSYLPCLAGCEWQAAAGLPTVLPAGALAGAA